jgi:hypothetical protein
MSNGADYAHFLFSYTDTPENRNGGDSKTVAALGFVTRGLGPSVSNMLLRLRLPQQSQHTLGQLIGLCHHGGTGLLQNLGA